MQTSSADQIKPLEDFDGLHVLGKLSSNLDTAYSVSIFDRTLALEPHTYPVKLEYARVFQQRGACKGTLMQCPGALQDLTMALKLGLADAKTYMYKSNIYVRMYNGMAAMADLNAAHAEEPNNAAVLNMRAQIKDISGDWAGAVADFDAAELIEPLPTQSLAGRDWLRAHQRAGFWSR